MLLIYPPVAKISEPPAGLAKLAGALNHFNISCRVVDANLEGMLHLLNTPCTAVTSDTWTRRACRHLQDHLIALRDGEIYQNIDRYKQAVTDINRVLQVKGRAAGVDLNLGNYVDHQLSPVKSIDLIKAATSFPQNLFYPYFSQRLPFLLKDEKPTMVGFSVNYLSQALCAFAMIGFLRHICPELKIILGGGLVTTWMRMPGWKNPFKGLVDDLIAGPGEEPLLSLLGKRHLKSNGMPDYQSFCRNRYIAPGFILPYSASSGCYWQRCSFCPERAEGNPYRPLPVKEAVRQMKRLVAQTKPALIHLLDNALSPSLLKALAENPPGAPWYGFARISRQLADVDFCRALKRSGCVMLKLGLESGAQNILDDMQKGISLEEASLGLEALEKAGIASYVYLLFGTPTETRGEAHKTLEFTVRHSSRMGFLNLAVFNLPAYGPEVDKLNTRQFYEGDLSLYKQFNHPKGWNRNQIRQFLNKSFKRHPAVSPILRRDPPVFTSNHAPFFVMKSRLWKNSD